MAWHGSAGLSNNPNSNRLPCEQLAEFHYPELSLYWQKPSITLIDLFNSMSSKELHIRFYNHLISYKYNETKKPAFL